MAKRWYSVSVLSNFEKKIADQIRQAVADAGLEDEIGGHGDPLVGVGGRVDEAG